LNAFIGCVNPETSHQGQFLICRDCKRVSEMNDNEIIELINSKAINNGFSATQQILEIEGQCNQCK
jgi:Fur family zinc uptake transcriptional regulator